MKDYEVKLIFVLFLAAAVAYAMDCITRSEFYLTMIASFSVYVLVLLCRVLQVLTDIERRLHETD